MTSTAEQEGCAHRTKHQHIDNSDGIVQLPYEILEAIFSTLPTPVVVLRVGAICKNWHAVVQDDEFWRLRCGLPELPSGFTSWFAYAQRQTMREQALDHLYGRAGLTQNWRKGLQLLSVLADAGDDYAMALYGWAVCNSAGIDVNKERGSQLLHQSKHVIARAYCLHEIGVQHDEKEAYRLLTTECDASDPHVLSMLGGCYRNGLGCKKDKARAVQYWERAGNHIGAAYALAFLLIKAGSTADRQRAIALLRLAGTQGRADAQCHLGAWYERGMPGVLQTDIVQAKHWYSLSAEQGYSNAIRALQRLNK